MSASTGGVQVGYNWQHGHFVLGVEADLQGAAIKGSKSFDLLWEDDASAHAQSKLDWFGTVRGRLGYAFDRTLVYFTGGFAFGEVKDTLNVSIWDDFGSDSKKGTRTGYVLGGGLEHKIDPSWSIKAEYQYIDLGSDKLAVEGGDGECSWASATFKADHSYNTVRVGLNYRLHQDYEPLK
ncbi:MAG: porin family protein [Rhodomicrobium sp.]|nr:porin family protein [Rhodomicrobium sp.]